MKKIVLTMSLSLFLIMGSTLGCDGQEKTTILGGLETGSTVVATSLIKALFSSLAVDQETSDSSSTSDTSEDSGS